MYALQEQPLTVLLEYFKSRRSIVLQYSFIISAYTVNYLWVLRMKAVYLWGGYKFNISQYYKYWCGTEYPLNMYGISFYCANSLFVEHHKSEKVRW